MRIFKFGGASVKDADGVKNVFDVLQKVGYEEVLLVVSAMGKTTNALEVVIKNYFEKSSGLSTTSTLYSVPTMNSSIRAAPYSFQTHPTCINT